MLENDQADGARAVVAVELHCGFVLLFCWWIGNRRRRCLLLLLCCSCFCSILVHGRLSVVEDVEMSLLGEVEPRVDAECGVVALGAGQW